MLLILLSGACDNNDLPYDASIIRLGPMQLESSPHDLREVARIKSLSEGFESGNLHSMSINISAPVWSTLRLAVNPGMPLTFRRCKVSRNRR